MKKIFFLYACIIIFALSCENKKETETNIVDYQKYRTELEHIFALDQKYRLLSDSLEEIYEWNSDTVQQVYELCHIQDSINLISIERIISEIGWPKKSIFGDSASYAAFLVLQHCGKTNIMEQYLPILKIASDSNELQKSSLALYIDRLKMFKGEKQIYGTQIVFNDSLQALVPYPIENPQKLDSLRKEAGLKPYKEYLRNFGIEQIQEK